MFELIFCVSIVLFVVGTAMRIYFASRRPNPIEYLLAIRGNFEYCNKLKNEWYNLLICYKDECYDYNVRFWQLKQAYEKARWSALFGAFLQRVKC